MELAVLMSIVLACPLHHINVALAKVQAENLTFQSSAYKLISNTKWLLFQAHDLV